jgi:hypothetical protein
MTIDNNRAAIILILIKVSPSISLLVILMDSENNVISKGYSFVAIALKKV